MQFRVPPPHFLFKNTTFPGPVVHEKADLCNGLDSYVANMRFEFITGAKDIDKHWDSYVKELKGLNVDRLVEIYNAAYDRMNDK